MKILFFVCSIILAPILVFAQKKEVDYSIEAKWPRMNNERISNDGRYLLYNVSHGKAHRELMVHSVDGQWFQRIPEGENAAFTEDSRYVVFTTGKDSLALYDLPGRKTEKLPNVLSYSLSYDGNAVWLAYRVAGPESKLVVRNLRTNAETYFMAVRNYICSDGGDRLLLGIKERDIVTVKMVDLRRGYARDIWCGFSEVTHLTFDASGMRAAFLATRDSAGSNINEVYSCVPGQDSAIVRASSNNRLLDSSLKVSTGGLHFSADGLKLFFSIGRDMATKRGERNNVTVWSYKDEFFPPEKIALSAENSGRSYTAVILQGSDIVIRINRDSDNVFLKENLGANSNYFLVYSKWPNAEWYWNKTFRPDLCLVSTSTGERRVLDTAMAMEDNDAGFSPGGRYAFWYDRAKSQYYTINIQTGVIRCISSGIPVHIYDELFDHAIMPPPAYGILGWSEGDSSLLVYDRYDIWSIDPEGNFKPFNMTDGYGRSHRLVLRLASVSKKFLTVNVINVKERLVLAAFDERTKQNGFFSLDTKNRSILQLTMDNWAYYFPRISFTSGTTLSGFLLKAKDAAVYLVKRMSAVEYPNIVSTTNFVNFRKISDLEPQLAYNWLNATLCHYTLQDGRRAEGILYRPENFDSTRKYPVIFHFYEKNADGLNKFRDPGLTSDDINIPFFVSRGYVIFVPDMYYRVSATGLSVYNSVMGAVNYLSRFSWVNTQRMGLQGHSFGGYEVNELITRTRVFVAAASASGQTDCISQYGSLLFGSGHSDHGDVEPGLIRLGGTLWQKKDVYVSNSPVLKADRVTTPLLMMHNANDRNVPFQQAVEYFTDLCRLGKQVWLLQYDGEAHSLLKEGDQLDYTTRLLEFFDHFLKDRPAPGWFR